MADRTRTGEGGGGVTRIHSANRAQWHVVALAVARLDAVARRVADESGDYEMGRMADSISMLLAATMARAQGR